MTDLSLQQELAAQTQDAYSWGMDREVARLASETRRYRIKADRAALAYIDNLENQAHRLHVLSAFARFFRAMTAWYRSEQALIGAEQQQIMTQIDPQYIDEVFQESARDLDALDDDFRNELAYLAELGGISEEDIANM